MCRALRSEHDQRRWFRNCNRVGGKACDTETGGVPLGGALITRLRESISPTTTRHSCCDHRNGKCGAWRSYGFSSLTLRVECDFSSLTLRVECDLWRSRETRCYLDAGLARNRTSFAASMSTPPSCLVRADGAARLRRSAAPSADICRVAEIFSLKPYSQRLLPHSSCVTKRVTVHDSSRITT